MILGSELIDYMSPNLPSPSKEVFLSTAPIPRVENMEKVLPPCVDRGDGGREEEDLKRH